MANAVIDRAKPIIEATITPMGYELVDLEYKRLYGDMHLIVYIYSKDGVSLDDCERVDAALEAPLDELDPTDGLAYCLDISSPGLDRPFKTQRDYERNYGEEVEVRLYAPLLGKKVYEGVLLEKTDNCVTLEVDGKPFSIELNRVALTRPLVKFE